MESAEKILAEMNGMLDAEHFDGDYFRELLGKLKSGYKPEICIIDLSFYNENRLKVLWKEKIRLVKLGEFEKGAIVRKMEEECRQYIQFRIDEKIEKSAFHYDGEFLFYLCTGSARNDDEILCILR